MLKSRTYFDYASLPPIDKRVLKEVAKYSSTKYANASAWHKEGVNAKNALADARSRIASYIHGHKVGVVFTSGGTESNNMALFGPVYSELEKGREYSDLHILVSEIEHSSIVECADELRRRGVQVDFVKVDSSGVMILDDVKNKIKPNTILISVMMVNNEVGTIQPIREIAKMVRQERTKRMSFLEVGPPELFFHCDASQAMHLEIDVEQLGVDLLTLDSSKFYGPRGIGMLYIKKDTAIKPVLFGGGQEGGMRSGTENIPAIRGFAKALDICDEEREREFKRLTGLRQQLIEGLKRPANIDFLRRLKSPAPIATVSCLTGGGKIRAIVAPAQSALTDAKNQYSLVSQNVISININGNDAKVSPHIINISIPGIDNEFFTLWLDARGISCSTRSACLHDGDESYVLKAMKADSSSSVRFSIGRWTKKGDITKLCKLISTFLLNNDPTKLKLGNQNA